jgi:hypothetical protein
MKRSIVLLLCAAVVSSGLAITGGAVAGTENAAANRCLRGDWRTTQAEARRILGILTGGNMTVAEGRLTASFSRTRMTYGSTHFVVRLQQGGFLLEGTANFVYGAPYTTRGENIVVGRGRSELFISKFRGENNGTSVTVPGPAPTTRILPAGPIPYKCRGDSMNLGMPGHPREAMRFLRAS